MTMSRKVALCRVSDTEPLLSLVRMLEYAGYECVLPAVDVNNFLKKLGCLNVDHLEDMRDRWGAEMPPDRFQYYDLHDLRSEELNLYVDINAFHNGPLLWKEEPWLQERTLCYFINGGPPRNTADKGDGITPACPVMTTNQWYATRTSQAYVDGVWHSMELPYAPWKDKSYVFYPSFERWGRIGPREPDFNGSPVCFCHNVMGWGYGEYVGAARKLGCKFYGGGSSPDGLVRHEDVFAKLAKAPCVVYLKGGGAVDYAVLEAMAMGVPVLFPRKYVQDTLIEPLTGHSTLLDEAGLIENLKTALNVIREPTRNYALGNWGKSSMQDRCWQPERDGPGFVEWLGRMFP